MTSLGNEENPAELSEIAEEKRPKFGNRFLTNDNDVFKHNAWDNVEWDEEQEQEALAAVNKNSTEKMKAEDKQKFQNDADKFWDSFYGVHQNRFFKDRHWLFTEFAELAALPETGVQKQRTIFELGCGVGNTILPILKYSQEPNLKVYGCDFSARAIEILRTSKEYDAKRCEVFVMDATLEEWPVPFAENSLDIIVLIFVLSAIEPAKMKSIAANCFRYLRPGGLLLFRDYGRYDMAQLRFKSGKCLEDNFYVRGDGTMVYFFTQEEVRDLFGNVGFVEEQSIVDRRLQVNRGRMLKMYRVWIQTKLRKPVNETPKE
ncbi:tRNA N(3)-methylcytidine methyltransferase Mettl2 isoform X2 [Anastrepha obliqua]|uniref:tRNA N(3)-methylcytidine methyltransferase Mettl2 isoform X2 n=1 Tax=Anastrepha obliqua TaxID=95512 RepID=UPI0024095456|nr:tRNA N(3)-methylcytidine methyltransferase Mettl2 isoform X2 [Anastrepha obliqua]